MTRLDVIAGVEQRTDVAYRVTAHRGGKTKQLGMADAAHLDVFLAAERQAMRGWRIEVAEEQFTRWVTGGTTDLAGVVPATNDRENRS